MKTLHSLLLLAAGLAVGLAIPIPQARPASASSPPSNAKPERSRSLRMPDSVRHEVRLIRSLKDRHERMQAVVRLAASLPVGDLKEWFEGNYLGFLDKDTADLFRLIAGERWMEVDPGGIARFMMDRKVSRSERYIEAWLKADPTAAKAYLDTREGEQRAELINDYTQIIGKTDVPGALEFISSLKELDRGSAYAALDDLAKVDRNAVMAYIEAWPAEQRSRARKSIAAAYLNTDFPWAIAQLQQEGETADSFTYTLLGTSPNFPAGVSRIARFASLPEGWADRIADRKALVLTSRCPADWLELRQAPSWLSPEAFQKFQLAAAAESNWDYERRPGDARRFVEQGDWLPAEVRAKLAAHLIRNWKDGEEQAEAWIATLDEDLRAETTQAFDLLRQRSRGSQQEWLAGSSPTLYLRSLLDPEPAITVNDGPESWDKSEIAEAIGSSNGLSQEECGKLLKGRNPLPPQLFAHLLQRSGDTLSPEQSINWHARVAADWGSEDPSAAAKWVESLPTGEARDWAAKNLVLRWSSYSPAAAKAWEAKMAVKP